MNDSNTRAKPDSSPGFRAGALAVEIRLLSIPTLSDLPTSRGEKKMGKAAAEAEGAAGTSGLASGVASGDMNVIAGDEVAGSANRQLVVVRFEDSDGSVGWGECSALNEIGYSNESAMSSFHALTGTRNPDPSKLPMAAAAIEMARLDLRLRKVGQSLAESMGLTSTTPPHRLAAKTEVETGRKARHKGKGGCSSRAHAA